MSEELLKRSAALTQRLFPWFQWPAEDFVVFEARYRVEGAPVTHARLLLPARAYNLHQLARWRLNLGDDVHVALHRRGRRAELRARRRDEGAKCERSRDRSLYPPDTAAAPAARLAGDN